MRLRCKLTGMTVAVWLALFWGVAAMGAEYPTKPIIMIIGWTPGGVVDLCARPLVNGAKKYLGQPIIIENKPGAGSMVAASLLRTKPPDGYTIAYQGFLSMALYYHTGKGDFHPIDDFTRIMGLTYNIYGIVVRADSPWKTIQDFIEYARRNPEKVTYGTFGQGSACHLMMEELASLAGGIQWTHMPFKGDAEMNPALLGNHVDALAYGGWKPLVDGGKSRLLATPTYQRTPSYPQVPTLKESGYDISWATLNFLTGPKGMPEPIVRRLHKDFKKAMDDPEFQTSLQKFNTVPFYLNSEDSEKFVRQEFERVGKLIRKLGLQKK